MAANTDENTRRNRDLTDGNLHAERTKVDGELIARDDALREDADEVIRLARKRADVVLHVARARADEAMGGDNPAERARVARERSQEDRALAAEHAASDEAVSAERELRRQAITELLALERRATDEALSNERARTDQSLQRRDDFFAMVSHDFLSLVTAVALNAAAIITEADEQDARGRRIIGRADSIRRATLQMEQVVKSLLDVAAIVAGGLHVDRRSADAALVVREAVLLFEPLAAAHGLRLEADIAVEPMPAVFDPPRIAQVLENLLTNAIKFTTAPGAVSVRVTRDGNEIESAVSDTGCGIPTDQLATIFDRFNRAPGTRAAGHGLGLYICQQLVAAHHGRLTVESEMGRGSTFKFRLPAADAPASVEI